MPHLSITTELGEVPHIYHGAFEVFGKLLCEIIGADRIKRVILSGRRIFVQSIDCLIIKGDLLVSQHFEAHSDKKLLSRLLV